MDKYFMPIYTTVVGIVIGFLVTKIKELVSKKKQQQSEESELTTAIKQGMVVLLRKQLFEYYEVYEFSESIPVSVWEEIDQTYKVYSSFGGNSSGDRVYKEMKSKHLGG